MSYTELGRGTVEEHEAVQSTVLNRMASGQRYFAHGKELNEHNVVTAPGQYQGVMNHPEEFSKYLAGTAVGAQNAAQAERNLRLTGRPTTKATFYIAYTDGSPPSDHEIMNLGRNLQPAGKVGRVYLYEPKPPSKK